MIWYMTVGAMDHAHPRPPIKIKKKSVVQSLPSRARRARTPRCPVGVVCFHLKSGLEVFGSSDHSKCLFCEFWMILRDQVTLTKVGKHLVRSQYAISSRSNRPNSRKWPKTVFWLIGSLKNALLWFLNDPSWPGNVAESWKTFSTIMICNIKSIQQIKLQKMAENLFFGSLDHSKMHFSDLWMILHDLVMLLNVGKHLVLSQYAISSRSNRPNSGNGQKPIFWLVESFKDVF